MLTGVSPKVFKLSGLRLMVKIPFPGYLSTLPFTLQMYFLSALIRSPTSLPEGLSSPSLWAQEMSVTRLQPQLH